MTYQAIVEQLLSEVGASRATLRLDTPGLNYPAVAEALVPNVRSIKADNSLDQRGAETARFLLKTGRLLIQEECATADPPPPPALLRTYGVKAQMLAPVRHAGVITGWLSVHYLASPRTWSAEDVGALERAQALAEEALATERLPGTYEVGDGGSLYAIEHGVGKPILFLHGWGTSSAAWKYQLADLAGEHHVLALDFRCFGASPAVVRPTAELFAKDVKDFIDRRGLSGVFLVGWSMGGLVVMSYCNQFGTHGLRAIGITDVSPRLAPAADWPLGVGVGTEIGTGLDHWRDLWDTNRDAVFQELTSVGFYDASKHEAEISWLLTESQKAAPNAMEALEDLFACDFRESVRRIDLPTLLLYGAHSTSTTMEVARYMLEALPRAELVIFEESGHLPMLEETARFNVVVDAFAKSH